jgi:hypothetical protein
MKWMENRTSDGHHASANLFLLVAPPGAVRVVLQGGEPSPWSGDATVIPSHEPIGYWAITNGVWAPVLGDEHNGVLVHRHLFDLMSGLDPSVAARRAVVEHAVPRTIAHSDYCLLRVRRKVGLSERGSEEGLTIPYAAALAEFPRHIVVSRCMRSALEAAGIQGVFAEPLLAA